MFVSFIKFKPLLSGIIFYDTHGMACPEKVSFMSDTAVITNKFKILDIESVVLDHAVGEFYTSLLPGLLNGCRCAVCCPETIWVTVARSSNNK